MCPAGEGKSKVHCRSAVQFGGVLPGYPNYCAPLVSVPDVIGLLAVWRHNKPQTKNQRECHRAGNLFAVHHFYAFSIQFREG